MEKFQCYNNEELLHALQTRLQSI